MYIPMYIPVDIVEHHIIPFVDQYQEDRDRLDHSLHILFGCYDIGVALALFTYPANTGPEKYLFNILFYSDYTNRIALLKEIKNY